MALILQFRAEFIQGLEIKMFLFLDEHFVLEVQNFTLSSVRYEHRTTTVRLGNFIIQVRLEHPISEFRVGPLFSLKSHLLRQPLLLVNIESSFLV